MGTFIKAKICIYSCCKSYVCKRSALLPHMVDGFCDRIVVGLLSSLVLSGFGIQRHDVNLRGEVN